jgi:uncharacterized protein YecE (DUF72 family)
MSSIYAGTSGFAYPAWKPKFYPAKLPATKFLEHYATRLNAVEINYTFRRLPSKSTLENWVAATPPGFVFALKANMRITHVQRLKNAEAATDLFFRSVDPLRSARRLGPVLFQLPPQVQCDAALLAEYLELLPRDLPCAFEFRHTSWLNEATYSLLEQHNVALCLAESEKLEIPEVITAGFVYFRLRKPDYPEEERRSIREKTERLVSGGKDVYVFFKHEDSPEGALYAEELLRR